jgi:hypothetical protein
MSLIDVYRRDLLLSQFLAGVDVWVLCPLESSLQLLQLVSRERGPAATLLPLQRNPGFGLRVRLVTATRACAGQKLPCWVTRQLELLYLIRFEVFTAVNFWIVISWFMTLCSCLCFHSFSVPRPLFTLFSFFVPFLLL